jgi:hypothetical protein
MRPKILNLLFLLGCRLNRLPVDTSSAERSVTVVAHVTDNLSGFRFGQVSFRSPDGKQVSTFVSFGRVSGTEADGVYHAIVPFPRYIEAGDWKVNSLYFEDNAHNRASFSPAELETRGLPTTVHVEDAPEFGRCLKVAAGKESGKTIYQGGFTTATCTVQSAMHTGRYEWHPGVTKPDFTTFLKGGTPTLETTSKVRVTCKTESGVGKYRSVTEVAGVILRLTGCESNGKKCAGPGLAEGEVETKTLEGVLGWENQALKKVALDVYPAGRTGLVVEYACAWGAPVVVTGSILVPVRAGIMSVTTVLRYRAAAGKQKPERFEGEGADVLLSSLGGGSAVQLGLTMTATQTGEEAVEVNAVV